MPSVVLELPDQYESVTRPVVYDIIDQIKRLTNIPLDTRIVYVGDFAEVNAQVGSTVKQREDDNIFMSQGQLTVKVEETYVEDRVINTAVLQAENKLIFYDRALRVRMFPNYTHNELALNITYRTPNQSAAKKFRDDIKIRRSMGRVENLHEVAYSYGIPAAFMPLLQEIYRLRENLGGYGDTLSDWFNSCVSNKATTVTTLIGSQPQVVIGETNIGILGWFDFLVTPDDETKSNDTGAFDISFTYRIRFDKPIAVVAKYPYVIHSQLLCERFRGNGQVYQLNDRLRSPSWSRFLFDQFTTLYPKDILGIDGVVIPYFDDWAPGHTYPSTSNILQVQIAVDPTDSTNVLSLYNLGDYHIDPVVMAFLVGEAPYLNKYGLSVVHIELYDGPTPVGDDQITVDDQLNVTTVFSMNVRNTYHLRIAAITDLTILTPQAQSRLRNAGPACLLFLTMLEGRLNGGVKLPKLVSGKAVTPADFNAAAQRINAQKLPYASPIEYVFMQTVGTFMVQAQSIDKLQPASIPSAR
jgi:hypothetical protein